MPGPCEAAASDAITSTYPRRSITCGRQARTVRKTPSRLTSMVRSKASGSIERTKPGGRHPRVRHHHVDAAEALDHGLHDAGEGVAVGHVGLERGRVRAALLRHARELLGLEPHEGDPGAAR